MDQTLFTVAAVDTNRRSESLGRVTGYLVVPWLLVVDSNKKNDEFRLPYRKAAAKIQQHAQHKMC